MTILTFPTTHPGGGALQSGDTYTGPNGTVYIYDGVKWLGSTTTVSGDVLQELAQDSAAASFIAGNSTNTGITFTYDDATGKMNATVTGGGAADRLTNNGHNVRLLSTGALQLPTEGAGQAIVGLSSTAANQDNNSLAKSFKIDVNGSNWYFDRYANLTLPLVPSGDTSVGTAFNTNPPDHTVTIQHNGGVDGGSGGELKFDYGSAEIKVVKDAGITQTWIFGSNGTTTFPHGEQLISQPEQIYLHKDNGAGVVSEIVLQPGAVGLASNTSAGNSILTVEPQAVGISITNADENNKQWLFRADGSVTLPDRLPISFTAVFDGAHMVNAIGFVDGPFWETTVTFSRSDEGDFNMSVDNIFPTLSMPSPQYQDGYTFNFTEADHGIPNYTLAITLDNIQLPGGAGWTANWLFSMAPAELPALVFADGLTISNIGTGSIISKSLSAATQNEGTLTFITEKSQVQFNNNSMVIGSKAITVTDDGVITATDEQGSKLEIALASMKMETYADPEGPYNLAYSRVYTQGVTAGLKAGVTDVSGETFSSVEVDGGSVVLRVTDGVVDSQLLFDGTLTLPGNILAGQTFSITATDVSIANLENIYINYQLVLAEYIAEFEGDPRLTGVTYPVGYATYDQLIVLSDLPSQALLPAALAAKNAYNDWQTAAGLTSVTVNVGDNKSWTFDGDGNLKLPAGGGIVDSNGTSVLGGGSSYSDLDVASFLTTNTTVTLTAVNTSNNALYTKIRLLEDDGAYINVQGTGGTTYTSSAWNYVSWNGNEIGGFGYANTPLAAIPTGAVFYINGDSGTQYTVTSNTTQSPAGYIHIGVAVGGPGFQSINSITVLADPVERSWSFDKNGKLTTPGEVWISSLNNSAGLVFTPNGSTDAGHIKVDDNYNMVVASSGDYTVRRNGFSILTALAGSTSLKGTVVKAGSGTLDDPGSSVVVAGPSDINGNNNEIKLHVVGGDSRTASIDLKSYYAGDNKIIVSVNSGSLKQWQFNDTGALSFPDSTEQTTAYQIALAPATSKGVSGNRAGMLAFDNANFYYCTLNYTDGVADIWVKTAWTLTSW